jgi:16S rRNA U516 pseudouridylate synthase RsuA-like enzyme
VQERLQKLIAQAGIASRRASEDLITEGVVTVNGKVAVLGTKADPETDHIKVRASSSISRSSRKKIHTFS